jgi:hypothetical protein
MDDAQRKGWRNFKFTVDVILAAALAHDDLVEAQSNEQPARSALRFNLLAAAAAEDPALPRSEWRDTQQLVTASLIEHDGELRIAFQALGFAALTRFAGRAARLVSSDGQIEIGFRFDSGGHGFAALADNQDIRRALADFLIVLD